MNRARTAARPRCRCCHGPRKRRADGRGWTGARGYCPACYERWRLAGQPAEGPPPGGEAVRIARITATCREAQAARIEDYLWLRRAGEIREQAAARVGVTARTALRVYERQAAEAASRRASMTLHVTTPAPVTGEDAEEAA